MSGEAAQTFVNEIATKADLAQLKHDLTLEFRTEFAEFKAEMVQLMVKHNRATIAAMVGLTAIFGAMVTIVFALS